MTNESTETGTSIIERELTPLEAATQADNVAMQILHDARVANKARVDELMMIDADERDDDWSDALTDAALPVKAARENAARTAQALADLIAADRWESNVALRQPIIDALKENIIVNRPSVMAERAIGVLRYVPAVEAVEAADGVDAVEAQPESFTCTLTLRFEDADTKAIAEAIIGAVNVEAFKAAELDGIAFSIVGIGETGEGGVSKAKIDLKPDDGKAPVASKAAPDAKPAGAGGASKGGGKALEFLYRNEWLGSRALLEAVERDNDPVVKEHAKGLETALRGSGNGLSNVAKTIAIKLSLPTRDAA